MPRLLNGSSLDAHRERHEDLVRDEVVVGLRARRRRVFDLHERHLVDRAEPVDDDLRECAFARPPALSTSMQHSGNLGGRIDERTRRRASRSRQGRRTRIHSARGRCARRRCATSADRPSSRRSRTVSARVRAGLLHQEPACHRARASAARGRRRRPPTENISRGRTHRES